MDSTCMRNCLIRSRDKLFLNTACLVYTSSVSMAEIVSGASSRFARKVIPTPVAPRREPLGRLSGCARKLSFARSLETDICLILRARSASTVALGALDAPAALASRATLEAGRWGRLSRLTSSRTRHTIGSCTRSATPSEHILNVILGYSSMRPRSFIFQMNSMDTRSWNFQAGCSAPFIVTLEKSTGCSEKVSWSSTCKSLIMRWNASELSTTAFSNEIPSTEINKSSSGRWSMMEMWTLSIRSLKLNSLLPPLDWLWSISAEGHEGIPCLSLCVPSVIRRICIPFSLVRTTVHCPG
mmetsp:Transcript_8100/g.15343  ORF Transcript_8100/g.15343 Transcript_8100/m.15343 type:complete len:298 (-) Transcript_8100:165-1058(-)